MQFAGEALDWVVNEAIGPRRWLFIFGRRSAGIASSDADSKPGERALNEWLPKFKREHLPTK